ncbi:MAG: sugar phosphate isomerase/epimerase family protein [Pirellulales bacterium]
MPALKIGIQIASLGLPLKQAVPLVAQWGVQAIELDARRGFTPDEASQTALRQLRKMLSDHRLRVSAVSYATRRGYDTLDDLERRVDGTKRAMTMAGALGSPVVVNRVGDIPEKTQGPAWDLLLQVLHDLGRHGQHAGALLAAETGGEEPAAIKRLLDALPIGSLGVDLNPGNLLVHGHSPLDAVQMLGPHILHVHATDGVRDRARGRGQLVPVGRGMADWPALLGALEEQDYRGDFTIERREADDPAYELEAAVKYLRSL